MLILVYTKFNRDNIRDNIGASEYSYYFVLKKFLPVLRNIGAVIEVEEPGKEVDIHYENAQAKGQDCIFLSFTAPHNTPSDLKCPTLPVFAWEYDTIPNENWGEELNQDWASLLSQFGSAITHSHHSVRAVQKELGEEYPILACPAPIPEPTFATNQDILKRSPINTYSVKISPELIDTDIVGLEDFGKVKGIDRRIEITHNLLRRWSYEVLEDTMPKWLFRGIRAIYIFMGLTVARSIRAVKRLFRWRKPSNTNEAITIKQDSKEATKELKGVIYTSILNIFDNRKNYEDMVAAFCFALKDKKDAVLVLKTPIGDSFYFYHRKVRLLLNRLPEFECRVIIIGNYLTSEEYKSLVNASSYYVNTSHGEGQCLPLMEFMAAGIPALAPQATALADYINSANSFIISTSSQKASWQHDSRNVIRTVNHRTDWYSTIEAFRSSYNVAKNNPEIYQEKALSASDTIKHHCSEERIQEKLQSFLLERIRNWHK